MRIREAPKEVFAPSAASISSYISSETIFAFLFSFPPIQFLRHVLASRESLPGDNINPGSPRWHLRPLVVSLANCLPAVLAKWRLRRAETRDCERVIKKSSRKTPAVSLSLSLILFFYFYPTLVRSDIRSTVKEESTKGTLSCPYSSRRRRRFIASGIYREQW